MALSISRADVPEGVIGGAEALLKKLYRAYPPATVTAAIAAFFIKLAVLETAEPITFAAPKRIAIPDTPASNFIGVLRLLKTAATPKYNPPPTAPVVAVFLPNPPNVPTVLTYYS
jgi:hypothetical protein